MPLNGAQWAGGAVAVPSLLDGNIVRCRAHPFAAIHSILLWLRDMTSNEPRQLSQSLRLLEMVKVQPFTTLDARSLGIMNCAQRISELRKQGHPIDTTYTTQTDEHEHAHRVAMYVWNPKEKRQAELWI